MQAPRPIVMAATTATDPTLASCHPATQALFCRSLTMMDSDGSLLPDKGLDLIESLHFRLSFKRDIVKMALRELIKKGMFVPAGNAVFSPKFRELQRSGLNALLEMTSKPTADGSERTAPVALPQDVAPPQDVPYQSIDALLSQAIVRHQVSNSRPLAPETHDERRRRLWREKKRAQRAQTDKQRQAELVRNEVSFLESSGVDFSDANRTVSDQSAAGQDGKLHHVEQGDMSPTVEGHVPTVEGHVPTSSSSSSGSGVFSSQTQDPEFTAVRSSSESDARGDKSSGDIEMSPRPPHSMSPVPSAKKVSKKETEGSLYGLSDRSDQILNEICRSSGFKFDCSISHGERVALVRADTTMEKSHVTRDRWKILAAFLVAGAYGARRGARPGSLPTIGYFFRSQKDPADGVVFLDEAFLMTTMRRAIDWDAEGRCGPLPDSLPVARGRTSAGTVAERESRRDDARTTLRIGLDDE